MIMALHELEVVGIALAAYKLNEGHYPDELTNLVPKYLDTVPLDPFTGELLTYRLNEHGYTLYSVGTDFEDDGGLDQQDRSNGDLVLRVGNGE